MGDPARIGVVPTFPRFGAHIPSLPSRQQLKSNSRRSLGLSTSIPFDYFDPSSDLMLTPLF
jgi:hypothetical protein